MNVAVVLSVHNDGLINIDTLESIFSYVSNDVLVVADGVAWPQIQHVDWPVAKVCGFKHGSSKAPYRNVALGLSLVQETYPDADWVCYTEYDVLFGSDRFKPNLKMAEEQGIGMLGFCGRVDEQRLTIIESLVGGELPTYYLLGCCQFFHRSFMDCLAEIDFFDRFLNLTNGFSDGEVPGYSGYDISEHLYPSLCRYFKKKIGVFSSYDLGEWHGAYEYYPVRWAPRLDPEEEFFEQACIMHPLKEMDHPLRAYQRNKREKWNMTHPVQKS